MSTCSVSFPLSWLEVTEPFQLVAHCLFLKGPKQEVWGDALPLPSQEFLSVLGDGGVDPSGTVPMVSEAQCCCGHTESQSGPKLISKNHHPMLTPDLGWACQREAVASTGHMLPRAGSDSRPGLTPHPCVGRHRAH